MFNHVRFAFAVLAAALVLAGCAPRPREPTTLYVDVPRTSITAVELRRTSCFGTCPAYTVRFTSDDRATYVGEGYAPRVGTFAGRVDFARLAAWVDSQQPETLADGYATNWVDTPTTTLIVERGISRKTVTTSMESQTPVRFEGIALALDGLAARTRWTPVNDLTPYVGLFAKGEQSFDIEVGYNQRLMVFGRTNSCGADEPPIRAVRARGALRLVCAHRASTLHLIPGGVRAEGDAVPAGVYQRITQRELDRRNGAVPLPAPQ